MMLDHLEVNIGVSDVDMKTAGFGGYREMSGINRNTNSILATIHDKTWFFYKNEQKVIDPFI